MFQFHDNIIIVNCCFLVCTHTLRIRHWAYRKNSRTFSGISQERFRYKTQQSLKAWKREVVPRGSGLQLLNPNSVPPLHKTNTHYVLMLKTPNIFVRYCSTKQQLVWTGLSAVRNTQHAFRLPCSVPDYTLWSATWEFLYYRQRQNIVTISLFPLFGDLPFRDLSRKRETERWIWLSPGENIFSISFTLSRVPSFSLIPLHTKDHRCRGRHLFTLLLFLSLMRESISFSLYLSPSFSLPALAQWRTEAIAYFRTHSFTFVHACDIYVIVLKRTDDKSPWVLRYGASEWSVYWSALPSSGREETIRELNWEKKVDKLQKSRNWNIKLYIPQSLWSQHTHKKNLHLEVLIRHQNHESLYDIEWSVLCSGFFTFREWTPVPSEPNSRYEWKTQMRVLHKRKK